MTNLSDSPVVSEVSPQSIPVAEEPVDLQTGPKEMSDEIIADETIE